MPSPTWHSSISLFDSEDGRREADMRQQTRYGQVPFARQPAEGMPAKTRITRFSPPQKMAVEKYQVEHRCPTCGQIIPSDSTADVQTEPAAQQPDMQYSPSQATAESVPLKAVHSLRQSQVSPTLPNMQASLRLEPEQELEAEEVLPIEEEFSRECVRRFEHELFADSDRLLFFDTFYNDYQLSTYQLYGILRALVSEQARLDVLRRCKDRISDLSIRWDQLCSLFRSKRSAEIFRREVKSVTR